VKKQYNAAAFPEAMRALPFCCWKRERDKCGRNKTDSPVWPDGKEEEIA